MKCHKMWHLGNKYLQCNQFNYQKSFSACENFWTCCSNTNPCKIDEGDCDRDDHCTENLRCGVGNCGSKYPNNSDCCEQKGKHIVIRNDCSLKFWNLKLKQNTESLVLFHRPKEHCISSDKKSNIKEGPFQIYNNTKKRVPSMKNDDQSFFLFSFSPKFTFDVCTIKKSPRHCLPPSVLSCLPCFTGPKAKKM